MAKEQASHVAGSAANAGGKVVGTAKDETARVASEAKTQVKDLFSRTRTQISDQAGTQQQRAAQGLHTVSDQLKGMADNTEGGMAKDLVQQVANRAGGFASWLEQHEPSDLLDETRNFARRRPGMFIAIAATAGVLIGRLTRSIASASSDSSDSSSTQMRPAPSAYPAYDEQTTTSASYGATASDGAGSYADGGFPTSGAGTGTGSEGTRP